jgi:hypothetical protein
LHGPTAGEASALSSHEASKQKRIGIGINSQDTSSQTSAKRLNGKL